MATIYQSERFFDARNTDTKYKALDLACAQLGPASRSHSVRKVIAQRILKAMGKGERDPARLCTIGLSALGLVIVSATRRAPAISGRANRESRIAHGH